MGLCQYVFETGSKDILDAELLGDQGTKLTRAGSLVDLLGDVVPIGLEIVLDLVEPGGDLLLGLAQATADATKTFESAAAESILVAFSDCCSKSVHEVDPRTGHLDEITGSPADEVHHQRDVVGLAHHQHGCLGTKST